jgi:hypothetical protein
MRGRLRGEGVANGDSAHRAAMLCIVASTACVRPETYDGPIDTSVAVMTLGGGPLIAPLSPGTIALEGRLLFVLGLSRPLVDFAPETRDADKRVVALVEADAPRARPIPWVEAFSADNDRLDALPELEGYFLPALDEDACTRSGGCLDVASDPPRASEEWCRVPCPEPPEPDPPKPAARPRPVGASADCGMRAVAEPPDEAGPRRCVAPRVEIPSCPEGQIPGLGACSPLSACPPGRFPADLDDTRTLFIDGAARAGGTGTRDSPLDRIEVAAIGPDVDVIAASGRLSFPVDPLPARPLSIRGSCIERLTLVGKTRSSSRLTIEDARIEATVLIDRGEFSARRVAWSGGLLRVGDPSGVDAGAAATLEAASIVHTGGAPLVMVERARFSLERALVTGTGTSAVISADRAEVRIRGLDAVGPQLVDARASRIEAQQVRSRASPRRSLFTVDGSSLTLDGFAAQTLRAPVVRAKGSEVTVRDSGLTGEASTLIELSGGMLRGQGLALRLAGEDPRSSTARCRPATPRSRYPGSTPRSTAGDWLRSATPQFGSSTWLPCVPRAAACPMPTSVSGRSSRSQGSARTSSSPARCSREPPRCWTYGWAETSRWRTSPSRVWCRRRASAGAPDTRSKSRPLARG